MARKKKRYRSKSKDQEGVGPRFRKGRGRETIDQLEGLKRQQKRSRKAYKEQERKDTGQPPPADEDYGRIDSDEKSVKRVKNRLRAIKTIEDAFDEFNS